MHGSKIDEIVFLFPQQIILKTIHNTLGHGLSCSVDSKINIYFSQNWTIVFLIFFSGEVNLILSYEACITSFQTKTLILNIRENVEKIDETQQFYRD